MKFTLKTKKKSLLRVALFVFRAVRLRCYCLPSWSGCFRCIAFCLGAERLRCFDFFPCQNFSEWNASQQPFKQPFFLATCSVKASRTKNLEIQIQICQNAKSFSALTIIRSHRGLVFFLPLPPTDGALLSTSVNSMVNPCFIYLFYWKIFIFVMLSHEDVGSAGEQPASNTIANLNKFSLSRLCRLFEFFLAIAT